MESRGFTFIARALRDGEHELAKGLVDRVFPLFYDPSEYNNEAAVRAYRDKILTQARRYFAPGGGGNDDDDDDDAWPASAWTAAQLRCLALYGPPPDDEYWTDKSARDRPTWVGDDGAEEWK